VAMEVEMVTEELLGAIRSLHSSFRIELRDSSCLELALTHIVLAATAGSCVISFASPRAAWAMEWDAGNSKWIERPELANPTHGAITEAFVKQTGRVYKLSFSDGGTPLVRWGFTADAISIRALA
jgi:hypothetical protein